MADGYEHGQQTRSNHLADGGFGRNLHAALVIRLGRAFAQARDLGELATDFLDHVGRSAANSTHGPWRRRRRASMAPEKETGKNLRVGHVDVRNAWPAA